jgi:hypothetical protein
MDMETFSWGFGWCLFPFLMFGLMALACLFMAARRGGCACHGPRSADREPPQTPRGPDAA